MFSVRPAILVSLFLLTGLFTFAQTTTTPAPSTEDTEAKAKLDALVQQSLNEMATGVTSLRLPENRAIVYAMIGDMDWQYDQKRARELFRNAGSELSSFNADAEKQSAAADNTRGPGRGFGAMMAFANDPRFQVIPLIAKHDAQLAWQTMLQTRRPDVANAMAKTTGTNQRGGRGGGGGGFGFDPSSLEASQELALEQQVASSAAEQDPDVAVRMIKDTIANGVPSTVLPLLQKLAKLDDKKAADLGADVVQKLVDSDMVKNTDPLRTSINFLQFATGDQAAGQPAAQGSSQPAADAQAKQFNFTTVEQKNIADKLVSTLMAMPTTPSPNTWFNQVIPLIDKIEPDRSAPLKQRQAELTSTTPANGQRGQGRNAMFNSTTTPEQIIAQLPMMADADKGTAYAALANKIGAIADDAQAKKLIDQIPDDQERAALQQRLDSADAARSIEAGKLDDARKQIGAIADHRQQLQKYVALAIAYIKSGKETDIETAKSILKDARVLTPGYPDTGDDLSDLMELVRGYAVVEPESAFKMVEPGIDMINEYVQATAVLSKYNRDRSFRNGELIFTPNAPGSSLAFRYVPQMQLLGKADLQRANQLLDRLSRPDARMILRLYVLQGATSTGDVSATQTPQRNGRNGRNN